MSVFHRMSPEVFPLDVLQNFSEHIFKNNSGRAFMDLIICMVSDKI